MPIAVFNRLVMMNSIVTILIIRAMDKLTSLMMLWLDSLGMVCVVVMVLVFSGVMMGVLVLVMIITTIYDS